MSAHVSLHLLGSLFLASLAGIFYPRLGFAMLVALMAWPLIFGAAA